ncbi:hypothetical protein MIR68_012263 [Amoeboaphelidium protococcarum]|nr:hypothetical protein MIR68_012263 [Amoeboaphelidium protococcarum]
MDLISWNVLEILKINNTQPHKSYWNYVAFIGGNPLKTSSARLNRFEFIYQVLQYPQCIAQYSSESLLQFCNAIIDLYGDEYLRFPNKQEVEALMKENETRGFPGMIGSIDCMHWQWKNCPKAFKGQYQGKEGVPTVILEAVASMSTYLWSSYFGLPGSCNDLNVLCSSQLQFVIILNFSYTTTVSTSPIASFQSVTRILIGPT